MDSTTKLFLRLKFEEYYRKSEINPIDKINLREFGFIFFDERYPEVLMRRHISFSDHAALLSFLASSVPAHAYHSSAHYRYPSARNMEEKVWISADLIFDLDADHLPKEYSYEIGLKKIKKEVIRLVRTLQREFGVEDFRIVFSGGRGYHIHVLDEEFTCLGSPERREIVDYITGNLNHEYFTGKISEDGRLYPEGNWDKKILKCMALWVKKVQDLMEKDQKKTKEYLSRITGMKRVSALIEKIKNTGPEEVRKGDMSIFIDSKKNVIKKLIDHILEKCIEARKINIDEPVTTDTKRLIRLPGSIHGGTGFMAMPLSPDELKEFDPLEDAIIFSERTVEITLRKDIRIKLKGQEFDLDRGKHRVPEYLAVFLLGRGYGKYGY